MENCTVNLLNRQQHTFHIVSVSPWPLLTSLAALALTTGGVAYMHLYQHGGKLLLLGLVLLCLSLIGWWRDVLREKHQGMHTLAVQRGLRLGVILFILSEVMFFFAFFWAYFHASISPTVEIGSVWPPAGIVPVGPWGLPAVNTLILLTSAVYLTAAHNACATEIDMDGDDIALRATDKELITHLVESTLLLALLFLMAQFNEYIEAPFSISDSIYGSTFFMTTGFHGFHVFVGGLFIAVQQLRLLGLFGEDFAPISKEHHIGFEAAAWYWHFVDVVWLFLFVFVYWWGVS